MNVAKYIGMDADQATISVAVRDSRGNLVLESILETKAEGILQFICGLRGSLLVTVEEGTWAAWLYDLLQPHVARVLACDPRKNALLKAGNKGDRIDGRRVEHASTCKSGCPLIFRVPHPLRFSLLQRVRVLTLRPNPFIRLPLAFALPTFRSAVYPDG